MRMYKPPPPLCLAFFFLFPNLPFVVCWMSVFPVIGKSPPLWWLLVISPFLLLGAAPLFSPGLCFFSPHEYPSPLPCRRRRFPSFPQMKSMIPLWPSSRVFLFFFYVFPFSCRRAALRSPLRRFCPAAFFFSPFFEPSRSRTLPVMGSFFFF